MAVDQPVSVSLAINHADLRRETTQSIAPDGSRKTPDRRPWGVRNTATYRPQTFRVRSTQASSMLSTRLSTGAAPPTVSPIRTTSPMASDWRVTEALSAAIQNDGPTAVIVQPLWLSLIHI